MNRPFIPEDENHYWKEMKEERLLIENSHEDYNDYILKHKNYTKRYGTPEQKRELEVRNEQIAKKLMEFLRSYKK